MFNYFISIPNYLQALIATLFTWAITALGSAVVFFFRKINQKVLDLMLALSAGVMIAASFWSLLAPAIDKANELGKVAWLVVLIGFFLGALFLVFSDKIFDYLLTKKKYKGNERYKRCLMLMFSITLHNIPEGLAIGVAFGSLINNSNPAALINAVMLAIGIGIQNFPEGSAISLPLRREGFSRKKSFFFGQLSGIVEPISAVIGAILVTMVNNILPYFLAFAAGAMIYVAISELIPESQKNENKSLMALFSIIGFSIMMVLDVALG